MTRIFSPALRAILALVVLALLLAAASVHAAEPQHSVDEQRMVGTWYGEFAPQPNAPVQRFITIRKADGTFTLQARIYEGGKMAAEARNAGLWGISNGMYFTVTTQVNGKRSDPKLPEAINAYLVQSIDANRFEYVHFASGRKFVVTRIEDGKATLAD